MQVNPAAPWFDSRAPFSLEHVMTSHLETGEAPVLHRIMVDGQLNLLRVRKYTGLQETAKITNSPALQRAQGRLAAERRRAAELGL